VRSREHVDEWMREFRLIQIGGASADHPIPELLRSTVEHLSTTYSAELTEPEERLLAAAQRGDDTVDLRYPVRDETEQVVAGWRDLLAQVDAYCANESLLTLQRPPDLVALQEWVTGQFLSQLAGEPPISWAEHRGA
jgi:hypothetical protein